MEEEEEEVRSGRAKTLKLYTVYCVCVGSVGPSMSWLSGFILKRL